MVKDTTRRIILTCRTHHVSFGPENIPHYIGGEQGYGEEPGQQHGEVPPGADPAVAGDRVAFAGVDENEIAPDTEEVGHLGELPEQVGPQPGPGQHSQLEPQAAPRFLLKV